MGMCLQGIRDIALQCLLDHGLECTGFGISGQGALGEFLPKGFRLLALFKATRRLAGVLATEAASAMFPYCCPSSSRKRSTVLIHSATGLKGWPHSCRNPPPHPMMSNFCRRTWFRLEEGMSNGV